MIDECQLENLIGSYSPVSCFLVVVAVDDASSLAEAETILNYLTKDGLCKEKAVILVANKTDLVRSRVVTVEGEYSPSITLPRSIHRKIQG